MYCGDSYDGRYGQSYGCSDGYNYYYGDCCNTATAVWINALIWTSAALLCCLCFSLLFCGVRRRRRRMHGAAHRRHMSTDSYDSYYDETAPRYEDTRRVQYAPPSHQNTSPRRNSDTIRTYTTSPNN